MISVCIPIYNFDVTGLIRELTDQAHQLLQPCEIILIDDGSAQKFKEINKEVIGQHQYIELAENIGRSRIRNLFLQYAKFPYLLFIDCDSKIISSGFLENYLQAIENHPGVVCGGRVYPGLPPAPEKRLRWKYGKGRESKSLEVRQKFPNQSFMTNNFLIRRDIFENIRFDERISTYGHEDTLFGFALKKQNITILHIDNPVLNGDLETNKEYLQKTKEAIINLAAILEYSGQDASLIQDISLLRIHDKIKYMDGLTSLLYNISRPAILFFLERGYVSLRAFDFYKLGILIQHLKK